MPVHLEIALDEVAQVVDSLLARIVDHIPEPSRQTVSTWDLCAYATRGKRREAASSRDIAESPKPGGSTTTG